MTNTLRDALLDQAEREGLTVCRTHNVALARGNSVCRRCDYLQTHTCEQGPLCAQMTRYIEAMNADAERYDDPMSRAYGYYPELEPSDPDATECPHWTCLGIVYGDCGACFAESMDEYSEATRIGEQFAEAAAEFDER